MDDQVKINGFRIELAEIEQVYSDHEAVDQAVAIVRNGKLIVYLKPAAGVAITNFVLEAIKTFAMISLTYYMIPRYISIFFFFFLNSIYKIIIDFDDV